MVKLKAPLNTVSMNWNGQELKVSKNGIVTAPDEAVFDLFAHGCTYAQEQISVDTADISTDVSTSVDNAAVI